MCSHRTYAVVGEKKYTTTLTQGLKEKGINAVRVKQRTLVTVWHFSSVRSMASILTSFFWFSLPLLLGIQIRSFTQADLISQNIQYIHSSETEKHSDAFSFTLSDGSSEVGKALHSLSEQVLIQYSLL